MLFRSGPGSLVDKKLWNCGNAGDQFWFRGNSFQYKDDVAIKLRGTPTKQAIIDDNVFPQGSVDDALDFTQGKTNIVIGSNTAGVQSFGNYGACDMDGDGRDDLFLPTGATWWYSSAGKVQWTYLNRAHERWGKIALGYFDGDQRCDVLTVDGGQILISSGGTGPWTPLGLSGVTFDQLAFGHFSNQTDHRPGHHLTEIFRRAPNGQWSYVIPGQHDRHALNSSSFPLDQLRFGDFNGDGITDVLAVEEGHWSISPGGIGSWQPLNTHLSTPMDEIAVADVDGNGTDDVIRPSFADGVTWYVSSDGRSDWVKLVTENLQQVGIEPLEKHLAFGHFTGSAGVDLLAFDSTARTALIASKANPQPTPYNLYPY